VNVYAPSDAFASNFGDDELVAASTVTVRTRNDPPQPAPPMPTNVPYFIAANHSTGSLLDTLTLAGARAHSMYWSNRFEYETSVFSLIAEALYLTDLEIAA
jgi:hypothetical protein